MQETLTIGATPANEECAQVGDADYGIKAYAECKRFIALIRKVCGNEPEGARLRVVAHSHDFGTYHEVGVTFDPDNKKAVDYAIKCENNAPTNWDD